MLSPTLATWRLTLHVLSASVWVGGQLVLAGLVPRLRSLSPDAPRTVARAFNRIAWPAFAIAVVTGMWNLAAIKIGDTSTAYQITVAIKLLAVTVSGVAALAHAMSRTKLVLAIGGALGLLGALLALFLGVLLRTGT